MMPIFSAAHSAKVHNGGGANGEWGESGVRWRRVQDADANGLRWGYSLEPVSSSSSSGEEQEDPTAGYVRAAHVSASSSHAPPRRKPDNMPIKPHTWISLWFLLTVPVIFWDAGYCFFRPRSMVGGDLHWMWKPYALYQEIDYVYGVKALQEGNGFTNAQSFLNIVETFMNIAYLYYAHIAQWPPAPLIGFAAATMTLSKTVLYWLQEFYCGGCSVGHNKAIDLVMYWIIPNGLWLVFPCLIIVQLFQDLAGALHFADAVATKSASGKKQ